MKRKGSSRVVVVLRSMAPLAATGFFLLVAIGLAYLQCLPGFFDPAQAASADVVPVVVEVNSPSAPNDLSTTIIVSGTNLEAGAGVQLDRTEAFESGRFTLRPRHDCCQAGVMPLRGRGLCACYVKTILQLIRR